MSTRAVSSPKRTNVADTKKTTRRKSTDSNSAAKGSNAANSSSKRAEQEIFQGKMNALNRVQAVIEFDLDGTILDANENFLRCTGYRLEEIQGKHHRIFVEPELAQSQEYLDFWQRLRSGELESGEYLRVSKSGKSIWLNASYNPIFDSSNRVVRIVKFASDITAQKSLQAENSAKLASIDQSQAVIEFDLHGNILFANKNFCTVTGYELEEIRGQHHRIFCDPEYTRTTEYQAFWERLRSGEVQSGQFKRFNKRGEVVWIQAAYNLVVDPRGKALKVIKYATDITAQKRLEFEIAEKQRLDAAATAELKDKVSQILSCVNEVAQGNFCVQFPDFGSDAIGEVSSAMQTAVTSIRTSLTEFSQVAETVATAAEQLTAASREISSGAQTQASSLEETASSLEEITSTVKQNTDNAQQARQLAVGSRDVAEKGGAVVSDAVAAMAGINQSSKKIADIITTIDEIAFQTNLLALNAAVEAARAGEQGRGFAVVAAEVRNLAQRSANAAREIKTLIEDSVSRVENGTQLVNKSGETLNDIVNSVKRVTDIVAEIAAASKEQLAGIEQVNKAVTQMDRVTQSNAAQTEEVSGTAASLLSHAEQLQSELAKFTLGNNTATAASQPATRSTQTRAAAPQKNTAATRTTAAANLSACSSEFDFGADCSATVMEF